MLKLEDAIQRCTDRCNLIGECVDIYQEMYRYKAIRQLPEKEIDKVYEEIAVAIFETNFDKW